LVTVLHPNRDPRIARALDAAAAAVLVVAIASVIVGIIVLGPPLLQWLGW
jgi:diacylglycerol kinase